MDDEIPTYSILKANNLHKSLSLWAGKTADRYCEAIVSVALPCGAVGLENAFPFHYKRWFDLPFTTGVSGSCVGCLSPVCDQLGLGGAVMDTRVILSLRLLLLEVPCVAP